MRHLAYVAAAALCIATIGNGGEGFASPAGLARIDGPSPLEFIQAKKKSETLERKVKRIWRNLTGHTFDVACPVFPIPLTRTTCTATGKSRDDARAKCQSQHRFCLITDARR